MKKCRCKHRKYNSCYRRKISQINIDILELILINNHITQEEIARKLNRTKNSIYRNIKEMKELNILERCGTDKNGY